jgi:hypothetical protein
MSFLTFNLANESFPWSGRLAIMKGCRCAQQSWPCRLLSCKLWNRRFEAIPTFNPAIAHAETGDHTQAIVFGIRVLARCEHLQDGNAGIILNQTIEWQHASLSAKGEM